MNKRQINSQNNKLSYQIKLYIFSIAVIPYVISYGSLISCQSKNIFGERCHSGNLNSIIFSDDDNYLYSYGTDGDILLWDFQLGQVLHQYLGDSSIVHATIDQYYLYSINSSGHFMSYKIKNASINLDIFLNNKFDKDNAKIFPQNKLIIGNDQFNKMLIAQNFSNNKKQVQMVNEYFRQMVEIITIGEQNECQAVIYQFGLYRICQELDDIIIKEINFDIKEMGNPFYIGSGNMVFSTSNKQISFFNIYNFQAQKLQRDIQIFKDFQLFGVNHVQSIKKVLLYGRYFVYQIDNDKIQLQIQSNYQKLIDLSKEEIQISSIQYSENILVAGTDNGQLVYYDMIKHSQTIFDFYQDYPIQKIFIQLNNVFFFGQNYASGIQIFSIETLSLKSQLRCFQREQILLPKASKLVYDDKSEELILLNHNYIERYDTFRDVSIQSYIGPQFNQESNFSSFINFEYNVAIFFDSESAIMVDRWSFNIITSTPFPSLSNYYQEMFLSSQAIAIFYAYKDCLQNCNLVANLKNRSFFYIDGLQKYLNISMRICIQSTFFISYRSSKIEYDEKNNWFVSFGYTKCKIIYFDIDVKNENCIFIDEKIISTCKHLIGNLNLKRDVMYLYYERNFTQVHELLRYPTLQLIKRTPSFQMQPCNNAKQYLLGINYVIVSICSMSLHLIDIFGNIFMSLDADICEFIIQQEIDQYLYLSRCNNLIIIDLYTQKIFKKLQFKSNISMLDFNNSDNIVYIVLQSGDLVLTNYSFAKLKNVRITNEINSLMIFPYNDKMYLVRELQKNQESDLGVFNKNEMYIENKVTFYGQYLTIYEMIWCDLLKQYAILTEKGLSFLDYNLREVFQYGNCGKEEYAHIHLLLIEALDLIIIYHSDSMCVVSLRDMQEIDFSFINDQLENEQFIVDITFISKNKSLLIRLSNSTDNIKLITYSLITFKQLKVINNLDGQLNNFLCYDYRYDLLFFDLYYTEFKIIIVNSEFQSIAEIISKSTENYASAFLFGEDFIVFATSRGTVDFIELSTYKVIVSEKFFTDIVRIFLYFPEDKTLLMCSKDQYCYYGFLDKQVYKRPVCSSFNAFAFKNLDIFIVGCYSLDENGQSQIKVLKLSNGDLIQTIQATYPIKASCLIPGTNSVIYIENNFEELDDELEIYIPNDEPEKTQILNLVQIDLSQFESNIDYHYNEEKKEFFQKNIYKDYSNDCYYIPSQDKTLFVYDLRQQTFSIAANFDNYIRQIDWQEGSDYIYLSSPSSIYKFNYKQRYIKIEMSIESNNFFIVNQFAILLSQPYQIVQLSLDQLIFINQVNLSHQIENYILIDKENYFLLYHYDGYISILNFNTLEIVLETQLHTSRIQGIKINLNMLYTFAKDGNFKMHLLSFEDKIAKQIQEIHFGQSLDNIILLQNVIPDKSHIELNNINEYPEPQTKTQQQTINDNQQQQQEFNQDKENTLDNRFILSFKNSRIILIYQVTQDNQIRKVGTLLLPFRNIKYSLEYIVRVQQLIAYCSFTVGLYDLIKYKAIYISNFNYLDNPIVQILFLQKNYLLISCYSSIQIIQILKPFTPIYFGRLNQVQYNQQDIKEIVNLLSDKLKVIDFIIVDNRSSAYEYFQAIKIIGLQQTSIVYFRLYLQKDFSDQFFCNIQLLNPNYFQLNNLYTEIQSLNYYIKNIEYVIKIAEDKEFITPFIEFVYQKNYKLIFEGELDEKLNIKNVFILTNTQFQTSFIDSYKFINLLIIIKEQINTGIDYFGSISFINCHITLARDFFQKNNNSSINDTVSRKLYNIDYLNQNYNQSQLSLNYQSLDEQNIKSQNNKNEDKKFKIFNINGCKFVYLYNMKITLLNFTNAILFNIQETTAISLSEIKIFSNNNKNFYLFFLYKGDKLVLNNIHVFYNKIVENSVIFFVQQMKNLYFMNIYIGSNYGENDKSGIFIVKNCEKFELVTVNFTKNQNLYFLNFNQVGTYPQFNEILTLQTLYAKVFFQSILITENLQNNKEIMRIESIESFNFQKSKILNNQGLFSIIMISDIQSIQILDVTFSHNIAQTQLLIIQSYIIKIYESSFNNNISIENGGAFQLIIFDQNEVIKQYQDIQNITKMICNVEIDNCKFSNNSALNSGGAIYLEQIDSNIQNTYFFNNTALIGGAIRYTKYQAQQVNWIKPNNIFNNIFIKNNGVLFGNNIASYPIIAAITSKITLDNYTIYDFQSGKSVDDILIYLLDEEYNIIKLEYQQQFNSLVEKIYISSKLDLIQLKKYIKLQKTKIIEYVQSFNLEVEIGINNDSIQLGNTTRFNYDKQESYFHINGLIIYGIPDSESRMVIKIPVIQQFGQNGFSQVIPPFIIPISFRRCIKGEVYVRRSNKIYSCLECSDDRYSLQEPPLFDTSIVCQQCPSQSALSCSKDQITLKAGYWRSSQNDDQILYCENKPSNCNGDISTGYCIEGYIGPLCEVCDTYGKVWKKSFGRSGDYECSECSTLENIVLRASLTIVVVCIYFYYTVKKTLEKSQRKAVAVVLRRLDLLMICNSGSPNEFAYSLQKLLLNFVQITSILNTYNLFNIFYSIQFLSFLGEPSQLTSTSIDCMLAKQKLIQIHYARSFLNLIMPFIYLFISLFLYLIAIFLFNLRFSWLFLNISYNLGMLFFQSGVIKAAIGMFSCRKIGNQIWIQSQVNQICYTNEHIQNLVFYFIPVAVIVIFIFPLIVFNKIRRRRFSLNEPAFIIKYGLFFIDYKQQCYYWELVKFFFRVILSLVANIFDSQSQTIKFNLSALILLFYWVYTTKKKPFLLIKMNEIDKNVTFLTVILFLVQNINKTDKSPSVVFFQYFNDLLIIFIYAFFIFKIIYELISTQKCIALTKIPLIKKIFKNNRSYTLKHFILWKKLRKQYFEAYKNMKSQDSLHQKIITQLTLESITPKADRSKLINSFQQRLKKKVIFSDTTLNFETSQTIPTLLTLENIHSTKSRSNFRVQFSDTKL